jgi:hypothetical protein
MPILQPIHVTALVYNVSSLSIRTAAGSEKSMTQEQLLALILSKPEPALLWQLRTAMLEVGLTEEAKPLQLVNEFYEFVIQLVASSTAREYSHFASILDMGAVGGVAIQNLMENKESADFTRRLLAGALSEVLMVMAARQYVKAWEEEMKAAYAAATWRLYERFWHLSSSMQEDADPGQRSALVAELMAPLRDDEVAGTVKAALIVHHYQLLLIAYLKIPA